jgi:hypothetical protein
LYVTCSEPFERFVIPISLWLTPLPAFGMPLVSSGGQTWAHEPLHTDFEPVSATQRYSVRPDGPMR